MLVGRLAPSPTGLLHVGHARSFLLAWCAARAAGGRVVLRIEDLDTERVQPGAEASLRRDLTWLGLDWDEEHRQAEGLARIQSALQRLLQSGLAYPCVCSRGDIRRAQSAPHLGEHAPPYPGTCRGRFASVAEATQAAGRPPAVRFALPTQTVSFIDELYGPQRFELWRLTGDFLIARHGGAPAYQLAVVVDDHAQGVTQVARGRDLLESTAQQLLLYRALGYAEPSFAHLPLALDASGQRLAKRSDSVSLAALRARGVSPGHIVSWAAQSVGLPAPKPELAPRELLPDFALGRVRAQDTRLALGSFGDSPNPLPR